MDKREAALIADEARITAGVTWAQLAETIEMPLIWTISAVLGQQKVPSDKAALIKEALLLDDEVAVQLTRQPTRGTGTSTGLPSDPTLYRFYEALIVYGPALKEFVHEEFGDGIMSAINFRMDARRVADPDGDRVVITFDGKFLPYSF